MWHHERVSDRDEAMQELKDALEDLRAQDTRLRRVAAALYKADKAKFTQKELVALTGYNREQIRRHIEDEKIRRGEIEPTARWLKNAERARKRAEREAAERKG